ncbi:MAG: PQQ-dependent sugar dehydrogenase [Xanthomonadales bacterium]|nr:PQQ-dependent sugar dehydrogenase [Xanthomonadales bacterium]
MPSFVIRLSAAVVATALLAACGVAKSPAPRAQPVVAEKGKVQEYPAAGGTLVVEELARGFEFPWALAFLPDGRMLVTEKPGRLLLLGADAKPEAEITGLPPIFVDGQAGLLDVALSPTFASDARVYLSFAEPNARGNLAGTAVARGRLDGHALRDVEVIYRQEPKLSSGTHVGSRLVFDRDGHLFVTQGENNKRATAQELDKLQGKLVRIDADGSVPNDNPFVGREGVRPEIWSYGHRNMQGAALNPVTGKLWTSEHGPKGGDEINIPAAGKNYGWPIITYGINYSGLAIPEAEGTAKDGMEQPHHYWPVSPALSGMAFYASDRVAAWRNSLFLGALAGTSVIRLGLDGDRIAGEERLLESRGERIRDVRVGPDGRVYLLTDSPDAKLLRLDLATR